MKLAVVTLVVLAILGAACKDDGAKTPVEQTLQAALAEAEQTPFDDATRDYAKQLCDPVQTLLESIGDTPFGQSETAEPTIDFATALGSFGELREPMEAFLDDLDDVDPPNELATYHDAFRREIAYTIEAIKAIEQSGIFAALLFATPPPEPEEPPGLEAAITLECGEQLKDVIDEFGGDFFGGGETPAPDGTGATAAPSPASGDIGEAVRSADFSLIVHSVTDPVIAGDSFFAPEAGKRWVAIEVSLTNISQESQDYGPFDFSLRDAENFQYDQSFIDIDQELSSGTLLPDETVRGRIGFEVPEAAQLIRITYESGFFDSTNRIDVLLGP